MTERWEVTVLGDGPDAALIAMEVGRGGIPVTWVRGTRGASATSLDGTVRRTPGDGLDLLFARPDGLRPVAEHRLQFLGTSAVSLDVLQSAPSARPGPGASTLRPAELAADWEQRARSFDVRVDPADPAAAGDRTVADAGDGPRPEAPRPLVVCCTGERAPLASSSSAATTLLGWRSVTLPAGAVERRFSLPSQQATVVDAVLAEGSGELLLGGYVVTHAQGLTVGVAARTARGPAAADWATRARPALDYFLQSRTVAPFLVGGSFGEERWTAVPRFAAGGTGLSDAGTLLVGGAAGLISAPTSFAPDWTLALRSARAASQAILRAGASPAPAETVLAEYRRTLVRTGVEREQRAVEAAERRFKWNPRVHRQYTRFLEALLHGMMSQPGSPKQRVRDTVRDARRAAGVRWTDLLRDALGGGS